MKSIVHSQHMYTTESSGYCMQQCDQRVHQIDKLIDFKFSLSGFPTDFISSGKCGSVWQFYGLDPILRKERGKIHQERGSEIMS